MSQVSMNDTAHIGTKPNPLLIRSLLCLGFIFCGRIGGFESYLNSQLLCFNMKADQGCLLDAYPLVPNLDYKIFCGPCGENLLSFVKLVLGVFNLHRVWMCLKKR